MTCKCESTEKSDLSQKIVSNTILVYNTIHYTFYQKLPKLFARLE